MIGKTASAGSGVSERGMGSTPGMMMMGPDYF